MSYLVLHIDMEFIVGAVCADNGNSYPVTNGADDLLWLYFFNNPHQNRVSFGKDNRTHYNNKEVNYYGRFFELVENEQETFTIRGIQKKSIELLEYSDLLKTLKEKYESVTHDNTNQIPTLITFSLSISELAKQKTVEYLKKQGFQIASYTIPLSELTCYYPFSKKEFIPANGDAVLLLAATNTSLHLMKLVFSDNYFMIDGEVKVYKGKGIDPRKRALVKFVVNEINKSVGALSTQDEMEDECTRKEQKAEEWLRRIDVQQQNRPLPITESLSIMPNAVRQILVRKDNIESDTGHYIQELVDIFDAFKSDRVRGDVTAIFLLGDCFQNSLVKERFEKQIHNEKLFLFANKDIQQILSVYPKVDFKRYIDQEARSKSLAEAEEQKQAEQRALEDRQRKIAEEDAKKQAEIQRAEQNRKEAEQLFGRAMELEKEGRLEDARINAENALALDKNNRGYKQFVTDLVEKINKLNEKNELYKSYLNNADKYLENNELEKALEEYEAAKKVFDNAEITKKIIEVERLIKNVAKKKATIYQLLSETQSLIEQKSFSKAQEKIREIITVDKENAEAKAFLSKIEKELQQQEKEQREKENKEKCEKILVVANNYFDKEEWEEAEQQYKSALELCPQEKNIKDRIKQCTTQIKAEKATFDELMFEAQVAEKKGRLQEALSCLEKALLLKSDDTLLYRMKVVKNKIKLNFDNSSNNSIPDTTIIINNPKNNIDFLGRTTEKQIIQDDDFLNSKSQQKNKKEEFIKTIDEDDFLGKKTTKIKEADDDFLKIKYCKHCGKPIGNGQYCKHCGKPI
jgi:tetratricopeptide (TPR) repeat protein